MEIKRVKEGGPAALSGRVFPGERWPTKTESSVDSVIPDISHEPATFREGGSHVCGRVARLATSQGLLHLPPIPGNVFVSSFRLRVHQGGGYTGPDQQEDSPYFF